ncbi:hypothetical protein M9Y10_015724 [Tritrichomonas musculus]|uniref:Uncharacterized protein n=1 Tax=Tritrichomonas musculus TaxID=1915356 RepID=A0ABR2L322_9EUKA
MSLIKAINKKETTFASPPSYIQLSIKVENRAAIKDLEDYFRKSAACLHLRLKDSNHLEYRDEIKKFEIPSSITDLQEVGRFVGMNFTPPYDVAFGSIAVNEDNNIICLNANHRLCDGGFFKFLMKNYTFNTPPKELPHFPRFTSDQYAEQISKAPEILSYLNDPNMTRIKEIKPVKSIKLAETNIFSKEFKRIYHPDGKNYNFTGNIIEDEKTGQKRYLDEAEIIIPAKLYKSYDAKKNAPEHLTEYLWLSQYFAASAYEGKPFKNLKIRTVNDLRRYLDHPDFLDCYHCAVTAPACPSVSPDDKLSKVASTLRDDLLRLRKNEAHYSILKAQTDPANLIPGIDLGITGVGAIRIRRPIVDVHCSFLANATQVGNYSRYIGSLFLMSFSGFNPDSPRNDITSKIMYNPNILSKKDADTYMRRIGYVLTHASLDQTIGEVFDEVVKVD